MQTSITGGQKLVAIGGGTGLSTLLAGLKQLVGKASEEIWIDSLSAIVTVSDDGGSSGRLRDELQMLPPGDIRNCMIALSEDANLISRLFRHRFRGDGGLGGHSFGNLFLAALTEVTGDFTEAIRLSSEVIASKGHIYPATLSDVRLVAELEDGSIVRGETHISASKVPIRRLHLEPEQCLPLPQALKAIRVADIITVGPGSLYTSILPNLLVAQVARVIGQSSATKIFVSNLMTQPGETDGYTAREHLEAIRKYAPEIHFDFVVVNNRRISDEQAKLYAAEGAYQIGIDDPIDEALDQTTEIMRGDLLDEGAKVRHHSSRLAQCVLKCRQRALAPVTV
ncbi:MAG TPA: gluconeogenesis factor YvcK family protein [Pyrinomonadaceae bacterium]|nr:gluconeogenesis factor YvcK family protein [Pyrinomonadaceae bacterium]